MCLIESSALCFTFFLFLTKHSKVIADLRSKATVIQPICYSNCKKPNVWGNSLLWNSPSQRIQVSDNLMTATHPQLKTDPSLTFLRKRSRNVSALFCPSLLSQRRGFLKPQGKNTLTLHRLPPLSLLVHYFRVMMGGSWADVKQLM